MSGLPASVRPDLVLRFGEMPTSKPLRAWLAGSGAEQIVIDPYGGLERADPQGSCTAPRRPRQAGRGLGGEARRRTRPALGLAARRAGRTGGDRERAGRRDWPDRAGPPPGPGPRPLRRRPRLYRLQHADPRPGGFPGGKRGGCPLPLQPRCQRNRRASFLGNRRRPRDCSADDDHHRRPRSAARPWRPRRDARRLHPGADRRHRQRRRRHLPLPSAKADADQRGVRSPAGHPAAASTSPRRPPCSALPTAGSTAWSSYPKRSAPAPA